MAAGNDNLKQALERLSNNQGIRDRVIRRYQAGGYLYSNGDGFADYILLQLVILEELRDLAGQIGLWAASQRLYRKIKLKHYWLVPVCFGLVLGLILGFVCCSIIKS